MAWKTHLALVVMAFAHLRQISYTYPSKYSVRGNRSAIIVGLAIRQAAQRRLVACAKCFDQGAGKRVYLSTKVVYTCKLWDPTSMMRLHIL